MLHLKSEKISRSASRKHIAKVLGWVKILENRCRLSIKFNKSEGAIGIVVALVLPIIVIASFILVVDVGQILRERRELVKVAESISLYVAERCAKNETCPVDVVNVSNSDPGPLSEFLTLNAKDGLTSFELCGFDSREPVVGLPRLQPCDESSSSVYDCKEDSVRDASGYKFSFVRVITSTKSNLENSGYLELFFAKLLPGGFDGVRVLACSQAAWSPVIQAPIVYPLALPVCDKLDGSIPNSSYPNIRFFAGYKSSDPVFNNPAPGSPSDPCYARPFGSTITNTITDKFFLKGAGIFNLVDREPLGCPNPTKPIFLRIGQVLELTTTSNDIINPCIGLLDQLGYEGSSKKQYGDFLDDYVLQQEIYLPVVSECLKVSDYVTIETSPSQCRAFRITGFATLKVYGVTLQVTNAETGSGPTGFNYPTKQPAQDWSTSGSADCSGNFCVFGEYKRTAPPKKPIPLPPGTLPPVNAGSQSVFLIP